MKPSQTGDHYDQIAEWWRDDLRDSTYGLAALERVLQFAPATGRSLDVGCGSQGRYLKRLLKAGYTVEGLDISPRMIELATEQFSACQFHVGDIANWSFPHRYELITAWDSTFHLPLNLQEPALRNMCGGLASGGALLFTCGGGDEAGEISGAFAGQKFDYSTLGVPAYLEILSDCGCFPKHLEYDQYPENHVVIMATKA